MALGGGIFLTQNKKVPGTFQNFASAKRDYSNLADRGYAAIVLEHDFGLNDEVLMLTSEAFQKDSLALLGYGYTHDKLKGLREVFKNAHTVFLYVLGTKTKASNDYATARMGGTRGNNIKIVITAQEDKFEVKTLVDTIEVDTQLVANASELIDNNYVDFKKEASLTATTGINLASGQNGTATDTDHQKALDTLEAYSFNTLACLSDEKGIKDLYIAYTKRMRDDTGAKFQLVGHNLGTTDNEGVYDVFNKAVGLTHELVYWVTGAAAGCDINKSLTNKVYNGEYEIDLNGAKTQEQLAELIKKGKFAFHRVGSNINVLEDINTFTSFTSEKNEDFSYNQVIRVLDQLAIDTANIFNSRYLGKVANDNDGRISLWNDIQTHRKEFERIRAIQNYDNSKLVIAPGSFKKAVAVNEYIEVTVAMSQMYVTTIVA